MSAMDELVNFQVDESMTSQFVGRVEFVCRKRLRYLPNRRSVWMAESEGGCVLLKIYDEHPKQKRDALREWRNAVALDSLGLKVATPLFFGRSEHGELVAGFGFIEEGKTLSEVLSKSSPDVQKLMLTRLVECHIAQYEKGVFQGDNHLGNYLWANDQLWMLDAGTFAFQSAPLSENDRGKNLALLIANIPLPLYELFKQVLGAVHRDSGIAAPKILGQSIFSARQLRLRKYFKKTRRSCSEFERNKINGVDCLFCRDIDVDLKEKLIDNPDQFFEKKDANELLKNGNTCSVVEVISNERLYILKRYNQKPLMYRWLHFLLTPRALSSWSGGQTLRLFGIATPRPMGCLLFRDGYLFRKGYLLMEKAEGDDLWELERRRPDDLKLKVPEEFEARKQEMKALLATHGDMKASNLVLSPESVLQLIDLDSLTFHRLRIAFKHGVKKDDARFVRNWDKSPELKLYFQELLGSTFGGGE